MIVLKGLQQRSLQQMSNDVSKTTTHTTLKLHTTLTEIETLNLKILRLENKLLEVSELFNEIAMPYQVHQHNYCYNRVSLI